MDGTQNLDIGCQEVTVKNKRVKKTGGSKIFKKLLDILHSGSERHVIQFTNDDKTEFEVKLTDKKNKKQWTEKDISLFLALDSISSKPREQKNLAEASKNRFKSNMTKLESAGYLEYLGPRQVSKAVVYKKYRILKACPIRDEIEEGYSLESTDTESKESSVDVSGSLGSPLKGSFSFPNTSHYSCLSGESSENDVYTSVTYPNVESLIYLPEANGEVVGGKEYVAADQNLSEKQYAEPPNSKDDVYTSVTYPNVESLIYLPVANGEVVRGKEYVAAEQNLSEKQYVEPPNSKNDVYTSVTYPNVESLIYLPVANGEVVRGKEYVAAEQNLSEKQYVEPPDSKNDVYTSVTYPNVESLIYLPEANGEVVGGKEYVAADQNLSEKQYAEPPNSKDDVYTSVTYPNVESLIYLPVANGEVVRGKEYVAAEQNLSEKQYVEPPNSKDDVYTSVTYENVESLIYVPVANGEVVGGKEYVAVAAEQNLSEKQYVEPPNSKNDVYASVTYENVESLIYVPVANGEVVGGKEYVAVAAEQNLSEKQYVEPPNSKNDVYTSVTYENVESLIYVPVANGEVVGGKEYVAVAAEQNLSEKQYVEPPNSKNDVYTSVTYQNVESLIYLPEANGEVVRGKEYVAVAAEQNLSEKQYVEPPNSNKRKLNFPDTQNKKCRELDWSPTKSYSDDVTLFEETEDDNKIFKDSANPFLSSALVSEERPGLISDSDWQNEYKIFSFDPETMYDCI